MRIFIMNKTAGNVWRIFLWTLMFVLLSSLRPIPFARMFVYDFFYDFKSFTFPFYI